MFVHTAPKAIRELASWGYLGLEVKAGTREAVINAKKTTITEDQDETWFNYIKRLWWNVKNGELVIQLMLLVTLCYLVLLTKH